LENLLLKNQQFSECCLKTSRLKVKQLTDERNQEELILVAGKKLRKLENRDSANIVKELSLFSYKGYRHKKN